MKMNLTKKIGLGVLILFVLIQFIPGKKNIGETGGPNAIDKVVTVNPQVAQILATSCFDCHSNNTKYPWYSAIQPFRFIMDKHVVDGKDELNFSEFKSYTKKRKLHKLDEVVEMLDNDEMPLKSYTIIHGNAKLSIEQKEQLKQWVKTAQQEIKAVN